MDQDIKSKNRGCAPKIRVFDGLVAAFVAALSVVAIFQGNRIQRLSQRLQSLEEKHQKDVRNFQSHIKGNELMKHQRLRRNVGGRNEDYEIIQNMFKTLELFKKEIDLRRKNEAAGVCNKTIVCTGPKGEPGSRGPKGDPGYTVVAQSAFAPTQKGQKGRKGDVGPPGLPGPSIEKPRIISKPRDVTARVGTMAMFSCASYGNPKPDVKWMFNGEPVTTANGRIRVLESRGLQVNNIASADAGTVKCVAENFLGKVSANAKLTVHTYPTITVSQKEITADLAKDIELACNANGIPKPTLTWKKVNGTLPDNSEVTTTGSLMIKYVKESDKGTYRCIGENDAGSAEASVVLLVKVPPSVGLMSKQVLTYSGMDTMELICRVTGFPRPSIKWEKINGKMPENAIITKEGNLILSSVGKEDQGNYKCVGENSAGKSEGIAEVRVQSMPDGSKPKNCKELLASGNGNSNQYMIWVDESKPILTYCDMETEGGGWTLIQRRRKDKIDFNRGWEDYKLGFGDASSSFWLGLEKIHKLTKNGAVLRIDLEDFSGNKVYAEYALFKVGPESQQYQLQVYGFSGNASDSLSYHNNMPFSTKDRDYDKHASRHCAVYYSGGWWYRGCHKSNLNGVYPTDSQNHPSAISWYYLKGRYGFIKEAEMKVRPMV